MAREKWLGSVFLGGEADPPTPGAICHSPFHFIHFLSYFDTSANVNKRAITVGGLSSSTTRQQVSVLSCAVTTGWRSIHNNNGLLVNRTRQELMAVFFEMSFTLSLSLSLSLSLYPLQSPNKSILNNNTQYPLQSIHQIIPNKSEGNVWTDGADVTSKPTKWTTRVRLLAAEM